MKNAKTAPLIAVKVRTASPQAEVSLGRSIVRAPIMMVRSGMERMGSFVALDRRREEVRFRVWNTK